MIAPSTKPFPRRIVVDTRVTSSPGRVVTAYLSIGDWVSRSISGNTGRRVWIDESAHCVAVTLQTKFNFSDQRGDNNE